MNSSVDDETTLFRGLPPFFVTLEDVDHSPVRTKARTFPRSLVHATLGKGEGEKSVYARGGSPFCTAEPGRSLTIRTRLERVSSFETETDADSTNLNSATPNAERGVEQRRHYTTPVEGKVSGNGGSYQSGKKRGYR